MSEGGRPEDLKVYQKAQQAERAIIALTSDRTFDRDFELRSQMRRTGKLQTAQALSTPLS